MKRAARVGEPRATFHAGAVSFEGRGILLPGPKRSGKSVLTLGLLLKGCRYLAGDVAVLEHRSLELVPSSSRGVSVRRAALALFPELEDRWTRLPTDPEGGPLQQVAFTSPARIGSRMSEPCRVDVVVFPVYDATAGGVHLEPLSPGQAVLQLLEGCISLGTDVDGGLGVIVDMLKGARPFRLRYHDVREACHRIIEVTRADRPTSLPATWAAQPCASQPGA